MLSTTDPVKTAILDSLSDGQWHSLTKVIKNNSKVIPGKNEKDKADYLHAFFAALAQEGHILLGENSSQRFTVESLRQWRLLRDMTEAKTITSPRFFGGVLEDDGWSLAPLRPYDIIHFRATGEVTQARVQQFLGCRGYITKDTDGLYRIMTLYGNDLFTELKEWSERNNYDVSGARLDKNTMRREITELPRTFFQDLCQFYGDFSHTLLRRNLSSIKKHIPDKDDRQQQIFLWVIDAVQRYNDATCIPFAAYLSKSLNSWVHDLGRKTYGRSVSDIELKFSRIIAAFEKEHNRAPTNREIAGAMDEPEEVVRKKLQSVNTVNSIRNITTLDSEDFDIPLTNSEDASHRLHGEMDQTLLSAVLTKAVKNVGAHPGIWLDLYQTSWGGKKNSSIAKSMGVDDNRLAQEQAEVTEQMRSLLTIEGN